MAKRKRKIILNHPPVSSPWHYPAGVSYLAGYLKEKGQEVTLRFGHIHGLEYVLRRQNEELAERALATVRNPEATLEEQAEARRSFEAISQSIKTEDSFSLERNNALYKAAYQDGTLQGTLLSAMCKGKNLWFDYFLKVELPLVDAIRPDVYGISTLDERQLIPSLVLAGMVKDAFPDMKVIMGGNFWSRVRSVFGDPGFEELFRYCDAIIYQEGYLPFSDFLENLELDKVPGIVWNDRGTVVVNEKAKEAIPFSLLPTPVLDTTARLFSPEKVMPLYTASNCYMQCEFCAISAASDTFLGKPRTMTAKHIVDHMTATTETRFDFYDEMLPIPLQLAIGEELKVRGKKATWYCYMTVTDQLLDENVCRSLYEAGCRGVQLGLESLDTDALGNNNKRWNHPDNYGKILANLYNAGIQVHVFILVGLPGEPHHQTLRWLGFLDTYGKYILTIKSGRYRVAKAAPDEYTQSKKVIMQEDTKPFHLNRDFSYVDTTNKKVDAMRDLLEQACREHWAYEITSILPWWVNRGRFSLSELEAMARQLPKAEPIRHVSKALAKASTIINEELKLKETVRFSSFAELVEYSKKL